MDDEMRERHGEGLIGDDEVLVASSVDAKTELVCGLG
jgi:hypothetical protein